jgi:hypothetical protein
MARALSEGPCLPLVLGPLALPPEEGRRTVSSQEGRQVQQAREARRLHGAGGAASAAAPHAPCANAHAAWQRSMLRRLTKGRRQRLQA